MAINYRACPDCGSKNTLKIVYGDPGSTLFMKAEAGMIRLGEGCADADSPAFFCSDCAYEWNREQAVDAAYCAIKMIKAYAGGYTDGCYYFDIDFVHPRVGWRCCGDQMDEELNKVIRESTASRFADQLKTVHLLDWDALYSDPDACGGTNWSLEIITGEKTIKKTGNNRFPVEWDSFCRMIQELTGKNFQ